MKKDNIPSSPFQRICLVVHPTKTAAKKLIPRIKKWFRRRRIQVLGEDQINYCDAVITLGGDGIILSVAPKAAKLGIPVFGVNLGRLGFMTTVDVKNMWDGFSQWLAGYWKESRRTLLEVRFPRTKKVAWALNDAVIRIGLNTRVTNVEACIDNVDLGDFTGDGVIVATTTGSTAYSLAAQGPIVHPDVDALLLTPICAHGFTQRPIVFPSKHILELRLKDARNEKNVQLTLDGQRVYKLKNGEPILFSKAPVQLMLVQNPKLPYFHVLREKLLWGGR